jgi:hypothetical protein
MSESLHLQLRMNSCARENAPNAACVAQIGEAAVRELPAFAPIWGASHAALITTTQLFCLALQSARSARVRHRWSASARRDPASSTGEGQTEWKG